MKALSVNAAFSAIALALLGASLGLAPKSSPQRSSEAETSAPPTGPFYYEREIASSDLAGRSLRELALMRNWIYARQGQPFRRVWLREFFEAQAWYEARSAVAPAALSELDRSNAETIARAELSIPRDELVGWRTALLERGQLSQKEEIELALLDERLGKGSGEEGTTRSSPLRDPSLLDALLTTESLADFSRRDLKLLKNLVYARRGRPFETEFLRVYFERMDWYEPDSAYTEERLTSIDRRNIRMIESWEQEIGGPLADEDEKRWISEA